MASPVPEATPSADVKPTEPTTKDLKSDVNGHAPSGEATPLSKDAQDSTKPTVNGDGDANTHSSANGVVKEDTEMGGTDPEPSTNPDAAPATAEQTVSQPTTESKPSDNATKEPLKSPERSKEAESPKDVEMSGTKEPTSPAPADKNESKAAEATATEPAAPAPPGPTPNDVAQADVAEVATTKPEQSDDKPAEKITETEAKPETSAGSPKAEPTKESTKESTNEANESKEEVKDAVKEAAEDESKKDDSNKDDYSKDDSALPTSEVDLHPASLSQLAIETDPMDTTTSPVQSSVEVSMTDVSGVKVAREREDDAVEEPAPKRAKTEPKEDQPSVEVSTPAPAASSEQPVTPTPTSAAALAGMEVEDLPKWNDAEFKARPIHQFQMKALRNAMARVKKTKNGANFRDSVEKLWPTVWDKYLEKVDKPIDLGEIDRGIRDWKYSTFGGIRDDLNLIIDNSLAFNGPDHPMTASAKAAIKSAWADIIVVPEEEPVRPKAAPKQGRVREARAVNVKPEAPPPAATSGAITAAAATGTATGASSTSSGAAATKPSAGSSTARRASTNADIDRPKRTVRAPKPKDIDYTTKPSRKKLKPELQFCDEVLTELMKDKYSHLNQWFNAPVDAEGLGIPTYYSVITQPMDFGKVHRMLHEGQFSNWKDFDKNLRLVFSNCYKFNGPPDPANVSGVAKQLEDMYNSQMKGKDTWLSKHAKANAPAAAPAANAGSDDEDDEDDEEDGGEIAGPDPSREVKDLEVRLREEMDKQTNLFAAETPNQSMIQIQQGIVNMVQQALLEAKKKLNEYKQKNGGSGGAASGSGGKSKKSKPSKPKGGAKGGSSKASGSAAQPKKSGGGGQKKKKNLTAADKDNIAGAINDLEYPHLDKAIDIIKRDTGQMESEDGELELDIDQLSHEALLKLWELCKKVLPGFGKDASAAAASSPEVSRGSSSKQAKTAAKPKKNKPMSAQEQEARIAQLRQIRDMYKPGQEPNDEAHSAHEATGMHDDDDDDSSDDSSEEE